MIPASADAKVGRAAVVWMPPSAATSSNAHSSRSWRGVALLGPAFQPGTDDLSDRPSIQIAEKRICRRIDGHKTYYGKRDL
jgi:hypothetical protein